MTPRVATRRWVRRLLRRRRPYRLYGPRISAERLNDIVADLWISNNGGHIKIEGRGRPWRTTEPVRLQPGVILEMVGQPMPYDKPSTYIQPEGAFPSIVIEDGANIGKRQPWGSSALINWCVDAQVPGVTALLQTGGNRSHIYSLTSTLGRVPLQHFILIDQRRIHDGQYSVYHHPVCTRAKYPLEIVKNIPDTRFINPFLYGNRQPGGCGVKLHSGVNNVKFLWPDVQFNSVGWDIGGNATQVTGGSWENRSGGEQYADACIILRSTSLDTTFRDYDLANFETLIDRSRIFVIEDGARKFMFDLLTGHVKPSDVPAGHEDHFRWAA